MIRDDIIRFGRELERERNAAYDMWTWLPSYRAAHKAHGQYAVEHQPPMDDLIKEASMCFSLIGGYIQGSPGDLMCPCGDDECEESFLNIKFASWGPQHIKAFFSETKEWMLIRKGA